MKLCLVMIGRFEKRKDGYYADKKNINAIERYLKYFDSINVVARVTEDNNGLYPRQKVDLKEARISFNLFEEKKGISRIKNRTVFKRVLVDSMKINDIVLCWAEPKTNLIVETAKKLNKQCIVYVGGCNKDTLLSSKSLMRKAVAYLVYYSNKLGIYNSDYVHYVTENELQKRYPTKGYSVGASYVNVDLEIDEITISKRYKRYDNLDDSVTLGIIGYLNEVKGIDTAIEALSKLKGKFRLKILGGGNPEGYKELATRLGVISNVDFDGTLEPGKQVLKWLDGIDIYLQPSRTEGLPRATIEAMSRGCPVISSDAMGLKELVAEEWRHKPGDSLRLALLINKLSEDPIKLKSLARNSFDTAKFYDRELLDQRIDEFFSEILSRVNRVKK